MMKKIIGFAFGLFCMAIPAMAGDHGFPALNTAGRYLGVGWSYYTFHSSVDGRFNVITNRHPACAYPSSSLSAFYSPDYTNFPPRPSSENQGSGFWRAPTITHLPPETRKLEESILQDQYRSGAAKVTPKRAPDFKPEELAPPKAEVKPVDPPKPKEPPPSWLKPYLDGEKSKAHGDVIDLEPSPNDGKQATKPRTANHLYR